MIFPPFKGFVRTFVLICVGVFLLEGFAQLGPFKEQLLFQRIVYFLGLVPDLLFRGMVYQLVTWIFIHGNLTHLLFNCFAFWMFGSLLQELWGERRFRNFVFIAAIFSGLIVGLWGLLDSEMSNIPTIGASGVVFAILIAVSRMFPHQMVLVFFVFPMRLRYFAYLMVAIEFYALYSSNQHGVSNIAHLGGALIGYLYISWTRMNRSGGGHGENWFQRMRNRWRLRRMRKKIRIIRVNESPRYHFEGVS